MKHHKLEVACIHGYTTEGFNGNNKYCLYNVSTVHQKVSPTLSFILLLNVLIKYILELNFRAPTTSKTMSPRCHLLQTNFHISHKPKSEAYFTIKCNLKPFYLSKLFFPLLGACGSQTHTHIFLSHPVWA